MRPHLDLSAVEAFVLVADLRSFTHAAEALGLTQAGVSLAAAARRRGWTAPAGPDAQAGAPVHGWRGLPAARPHPARRARAGADDPARTRTRADHRDQRPCGRPRAARDPGPVHACDPALMLKVRVNYSRNVIAQFDDGLADVAVVRRQGKRRDGELLFEDQYGWFASVGARLDGKLLPLITVTDECGVGETATRLLAAAKTPGLTHFLAAASPPRSPRPVRASACYPCPGGWRRPGWSMWAARWRFHPARRADHDARQAIRCPDHSDAARVGRGLSQRGRPALSHRASIRLVAAVDKLSRFAYFGARPRRPIVRRRNFPSR